MVFADRGVETCWGKNWECLLAEAAWRIQRLGPRRHLQNPKMAAQLSTGLDTIWVNVTTTCGKGDRINKACLNLGNGDNIQKLRTAYGSMLTPTIQSNQDQRPTL